MWSLSNRLFMGLSSVMVYEIICLGARYKQWKSFSLVPTELRRYNRALMQTYAMFSFVSFWLFLSLFGCWVCMCKIIVSEVIRHTDVFNFIICDKNAFVIFFFFFFFLFLCEIIIYVLWFCVMYIFYSKGK